MQQATLNRQLDNSGSMFWYEDKPPVCDLDGCEDVSTSRLSLYKANGKPTGRQDRIKLCQSHIDQAEARWTTANRKHVKETFESTLSRDTILSVPA